MNRQRGSDLKCESIIKAESQDLGQVGPVVEFFG